MRYSITRVCEFDGEPSFAFFHANAFREAIDLSYRLARQEIGAFVFIKDWE